MLCQFTFENFKSYKTKAVLDFNAASISEHSDSLILGYDGRSEFLPVISIYGSNGGGKSNVLNALAFVVELVTIPIRFFRKDSKPSEDRAESCTPFIFDEESKNLPSNFEVYYSVGDSLFRYNISLQNCEIVFESLYIKEGPSTRKHRKVFVRNRDVFELGTDLASLKSSNLQVNKKMPLLAYIEINNSFKVIEKAVSWFLNCKLVNYSNEHLERYVPLPSDVERKNKLIAILKSLGFSICDYQVIDKNSEMTTDNIRIFHEINEKKYSIKLDEESKGTIKYIGALIRALGACETGSLCVVDELDAKLHPKLLEQTILLFKNKEINTKGGQLLFTSHDMYTLDRRIFRRDEIMFAAMDDSGSSDLYSLYDIITEDGTRINATASYSKQYLSGRYGADPYFSKIMGMGKADE